MRSLVTLVLAALFALPFATSAQSTNPPALLPNKCTSQGATGDPTEIKNFVDGVTTDLTIKQFLNKKVYCANACYKERISISRIKVGDKDALQFKVVGTNECTDKSKLPKDQTPPRGCSQGQTQPTVTVDVPEMSSAFSTYLKAQTVGPKSRCSDDVVNGTSGIFDKIGAACETTAQRVLGSCTDVIRSTQADIDAIKNAPNTATPTPNEQTAPVTTPVTAPAPDVAKPPPVPTNDAALAQVLTDKYGVPADQAKSLVESDADKIKAMIEKSNSNDTAGAQAIAKELKLNDDVMTKIADMTPPKQMTPEDAKAIYEQQQTDRRNQTNTFEQNAQSNPGLPTQCGTGGLAGNIMFAESRCAQINSNPLSSVQGPYHFLCGTWTAYANSTGNGQYSNCAYRNDPAISTQVMNAKMDQFASQYGSQCSQAGLSITSCQYAIHVFGETGYRQIFNAYQNNPNDSAFSLCGSSISNAACSNNASIFKNGGTVAGVFGELDRRLGGNGTVISNINPNASPFSGFTSGTGYSTQVGSPFSNANLFSYGSTGYSTPTGYSTQTGYSSSYGYSPTSGTGGSPLASLFSGFFGTRLQPVPAQPYPAQQVTYNPAQTQAQAVVSVIAQPQNAYVGNFVVISWSSVGMNIDQPCITTLVTKSGTTTIGRSNEGSKIITATSTGIMQFTVACTAQNGQPMTQATNVAVH